MKLFEVATVAIIGFGIIILVVIGMLEHDQNKKIKELCKSEKIQKQCEDMSTFKKRVP